MTTDGDVGGEESTTSQGSPKQRVKFLCSHGGKILPRPADGHLKYVGGETRIISVPRDIIFPELMKKLTNLFDCDMILKYQVVSEDLDALVSVKSDEDLRHMFDEYDRQEIQGTPRLRAFLFPTNPIIIDNQTGSMEPHALEQRYIDAINGFIRTTRSRPRPLSIHASPRHLSINSNSAFYNISSSACSSPRSPDSSTTITDTSFLNGKTHMNRVHSSPSFCDLDGQNHHSNHQIQPQHHHNHYYQNYQQPNHHNHNNSYQSNKPPLDPNPQRGGASEQLVKYRSVGQGDPSRYQVDHGPHNYYPTTRQSRGSVCCNKCMHYDDYGACIDRRIDRAESLPTSPSLQSPRHGYYGAKAWDTAGDG